MPRDEFGLIARCLRPLAAGFPGAFRLTDDAALIEPATGEGLVVTADAMVEGIHFLPGDPPESVAAKLLRINLSDLAAMGAKPFGYLLTAVFPKTTTEAWIDSFADGLANDQAAYGVHLLGGDTTSTSGPVTLSLTALGTVPDGQVLRRSSARPGDLVYVSGTLGDAALGLLILNEELTGLDPEDQSMLVERYWYPQPRPALGEALRQRRLATAALDVSDGLVADLAHITETSGLAAMIEAADVPMSDAVRRAVAAQPGLLTQVLTGGDDYELLFTVDPARAEAVAALADELGLMLSPIGAMAPGTGVEVRDAAGRPMTLATGGWTHF